MRVSEVAKRYAKALFDVGEESSSSETLAKELISIESLLTQDTELFQFILSPLVKASDKEAALNAAIQNVDVSETMQSFLLLLARKGRLSIIDDITKGFLLQIDSKSGITRGQVTTAKPVDEEQKKEIKRILLFIDDL